MMRVKNKILFMILLLLLFTLILGNILYAKQYNRERSCFLKTSWDQEGVYAKYAPDHWRLGCWPLAIAQILYYHRIQPHGFASYKSSTGYVINEDLNYHFKWKLFVRKVDSNTPAESVDEVSKYIYFASVIFQKDFGTNIYVENSDPHWLDGHYNCSFIEYDSSEHSLDEIKSIIMKEIDHKRPVLLNIKSLSKIGLAHAVVIDGYRENNDEFFIHIVFGANGDYDDWYNFYTAIRELDDNSFRHIMTIKPN
jgi:hypothetical protein